MLIRCEAYLSINRPFGVAKLAVTGLSGHCSSIHSRRDQHDLVFENADASIRTLERGLLLRVEAHDCMLCLGMKMLIEGEIGRHSKDMPDEILWIAADPEPFKAIAAILAGGVRNPSPT